MPRTKKQPNHYKETAKFALRIALLIIVPVAAGRLMNLEGEWKLVAENILPVVLPIIDRWIHLDPRIKAKGLLPF